jgi:hypothetical protein
MSEPDFPSSDVSLLERADAAADALRLPERRQGPRDEASAWPSLPLKLNGRLTQYRVRKVQHRWLSALAPWRDRSLGDACGLWLAPCNVVHTLGLRHEVDVVFLKADGTIARVARRLPPWRFISCRQASSALRLRAGTVKLLRLKPGMALDLAA